MQRVGRAAAEYISLSGCVPAERRAYIPRRCSGTDVRTATSWMRLLTVDLQSCTGGFCCPPSLPYQSTNTTRQLGARDVDQGREGLRGRRTDKLNDQAEGSRSASAATCPGREERSHTGAVDHNADVGVSSGMPKLHRCALCAIIPVDVAGERPNGKLQDGDDTVGNRVRWYSDTSNEMA